MVLPPITQETILLDLDPYAVKSYNAMQAAIAINAIDSERTDQVRISLILISILSLDYGSQDYLFHPKVRQVVLKTVVQLIRSIEYRASQNYS